MRLAILSFVTASTLFLTDVSQGAEPQSGKPNSAPVRRFGPGSYNKQAAIGAYGRAVYPKYYWGFHARELQNVGVPHGDIGILGSGLSRDPW